MDPLTYIYVALGSAFFGSMVTKAYAKLNGNGTRERLARIETELEFIRHELDELKHLVKEKCFIEVRA